MQITYEVSTINEVAASCNPLAYLRTKKFAFGAVRLYAEA